MRLKTLSPSSIGTYDNCQFQWYLKYILNMPDDSLPSALLGTAVHDVMETLAKYKIEKTPKSKQTSWKKLWFAAQDKYSKNTARDPKAEETWKKIKVNDIKACYFAMEELMATRYNPLSSNVISAEQTVYMPIELEGFEVDQIGDEKVFLKIIGKIDRIDRIDDNTIEIIDYKTGSRKGFSFNNSNREKKEINDFYDDIQLRMYHLVGKHLFPNTKQVIVTIYYIKDGGPFSVVFDDSFIPATMKFIKDKKQDILTNDDPHPNKGWHCSKLCTFGKNGMCEKVLGTKNEFGLSFATDMFKKEKQPR